MSIYLRLLFSTSNHVTLPRRIRMPRLVQIRYSVATATYHPRPTRTKSRTTHHPPPHHHSPLGLGTRGLSPSALCISQVVGISQAVCISQHLTLLGSWLGPCREISATFCCSNMQQTGTLSLGWLSRR